LKISAGGVMARQHTVMRIIALGDRDPTYLTHREVDAALALIPDADWVATDDPAARDLDDVAGVWLLPGTPYRDADAAMHAVRHCLATGTRFLGTCGGFQHACLALVRDRAGLADAAHAETDPDAPDPAIAPLRCTLYGETRTITPVPGTRLAQLTGAEPFQGFHYCGYGLSPAAERALRAACVTISATAPDAGVEAIELPDHPFFLATAFQPQVGVSESGRLPALVAALAD
jgi:CTP synthase (UTP-ammonia lyase)